MGSNPGAVLIAALVQSNKFGDVWAISEWHRTKNEVFQQGFFQLMWPNLRSWSHLLKKSLIENFSFCAVWRFTQYNIDSYYDDINNKNSNNNNNNNNQQDNVSYNMGEIKSITLQFNIPIFTSFRRSLPPLSSTHQY